MHCGVVEIAGHTLSDTVRLLSQRLITTFAISGQPPHPCMTTGHLFSRTRVLKEQISTAQGGIIKDESNNMGFYWKSNTLSDPKEEYKSKERGYCCYSA